MTLSPRMTQALALAAIFALVAVGIAALLFAVSWRQHYGPCGSADTRGNVGSFTCVNR